jgi:hypothetical protein
VAAHGIIEPIEIVGKHLPIEQVICPPQPGVALPNPADPKLRPPAFQCFDRVVFKWYYSLAVGR